MARSWDIAGWLDDADDWHDSAKDDYQPPTAEDLAGSEMVIVHWVADNGDEHFHTVYSPVGFDPDDFDTLVADLESEYG